MNKYESLDDIETNTPYLFYGVDDKGRPFYSTGIKAKTPDYELSKDEPKKLKIMLDQHMYNFKIKYYLQLEWDIKN